MKFFKYIVFTSLFVMLFTPNLMAQQQAYISYKIDGRLFSFKQGQVEYYQQDGYISIVCEKVDMVSDPSGSGQTLEVTVGVTIQLTGDESTFIGTHRANSADLMPTYFYWHEIISTPDKRGKDLKVYLAGLDSGDPSKMEIVLTIASFGSGDGLVSGNFSGKVFDEDGVLHKVTDGVFLLPREDM